LAFGAALLRGGQISVAGVSRSVSSPVLWWLAVLLLQGFLQPGKAVSNGVATISAGHALSA
jgi:hypothetical protein